MKDWQEAIYNIYTEQKTPLEKGVRDRLKAIKTDKLQLPGLGPGKGLTVKLSSNTYAVREIIMNTFLMLDIITPEEYDDFKDAIKRGYDDGSGGGKGFGGKVAGILLAKILQDKNDIIHERLDEIFNYLDDKIITHVKRKITNSSTIAQSTLSQTLKNAEAQELRAQNKAIKNSVIDTLADMGADMGVAVDIADYTTDKYMSVELAILDSLEDTQDLTFVSIDTIGVDAEGDTKLRNIIKQLSGKNSLTVETDNRGITTYDFFVPVGSDAEKMLIGNDFESMSEDPEALDEHMSNLEASLRRATGRDSRLAITILPPSGIKEVIQSLRMEMEKGLSRTRKARYRVDADREERVSDEEPEYGSPLPDAPEMDGDTEDYSPPYSSRPSFAGDDEDFGGAPSWAREDEEHEGARRDPREEYDLEGGDPRALGSEFYDDEPVCDECKGRGGKEYPFQGEMEWDTCRRCNGKGKSKFSKYPKDPDEEINEDIKMSPQQINQWMYMQRATRMQNNLRQNERWGNY